MRILVVAPHPDDEVLGCGGAIARHVANGDEVHVVVVGRGIPEQFSDESVARSRSELARAHEVLGVTGCRFLDFPVPRLDVVPAHELADALGSLLQELAPHTVYLPHHGDIHSDHRQVHHATLVAARPLAGCTVRRILAYGVLLVVLAGGLWQSGAWTWVTRAVSSAPSASAPAVIETVVVEQVGWSGAPISAAVPLPSPPPAVAEVPETPTVTVAAVAADDTPIADPDTEAPAE